MADPAAETPAITHEEQPSGGRYALSVPGGEAELTWSRAGTRMILDHTFVPPSARGGEVGLRLVRRAVEDARAAGRTIVPLCSYARAQFERHPEWQDVLAR